MTFIAIDVNDAATARPTGTIAPLRNVSLFTELLERVVSRPSHLPGMGVFYGFSGYGKTFSATYGAHKQRAFYVEVGDSWTKAKFCRALLTELGLDARGTIADMIDRIIAALVDNQRPIIIDEFDHVARRNYVETVREIHDKSGAPIVIIGEELLPQALLRWERFHNRILDWVPAQPVDARDVEELVRLYASEIEIAADLRDLILRKSDGRVRRVITNIERVREFAVLEGLERVDREAWGDRPLFSGQPPARRQGGV